LAATLLWDMPLTYKSVAAARFDTNKAAISH
jgi:hypothetical protein